MIKIVADSRESRSAIIGVLRSLPEYEIEVRELSAGDFLLRDDFAVERKTAVDFVASIMDRRLFSQVTKMKVEFGRAVFVIEGDIFATRSAIGVDALHGAIAYLVALEGATIVPSNGPIDTAHLLSTMARQLQQGLGYELGLRTQKPKDTNLGAEFVVQGLPGVGGATAKTLLKHFGSVERIVAADIPQLMAVPGIGKKTAEGIRSIVASPYSGM